MNTATDSAASVFLKRKTSSTEKTRAKLEAQIATLDNRVQKALVADGPRQEPTVSAKPERIRIWGVPFSCLTLVDTLHYIDQLVAAGKPGYFITANLNYNMLTHRHRDLEKINTDAAFIICDGMPMVKYSRWLGRPLPERVAGSELIFALSHWAAEKGHRVFFLGGAPGVAQSAADKLTARYPNLQVVGVESPPFRPLTEDEESALVGRVRDAGADIVYVAFGQPKGERWIAKHYRAMGAPACVQIGASFDFVAGDVSRAPKWMQQLGMEWFYRLAQEPRRLTRRYWRNGWFLIGAMMRDALRVIAPSATSEPPSAVDEGSA